MQEIWLWFLVREDPLGKGMATHPLQYSCLENPMDRGAWQGCKESDMNEWLTLSLLHLYILQGEKVWDFSLRLGICLQIWGFQYEHLPENAAETHPWSSMVHRACPGRTCARARVLCYTWASAPWRMGFLCSLWWCVGRERRGGWKVSGRAPVGEGSCTNRENTDNWVWRVRGCLRKTRLTKGVLALNWHLVNARCLLPLGTECALSLSLWELSALSLSLSFCFYNEMTLFTSLQWGRKFPSVIFTSHLCVKGNFIRSEAVPLAAAAHKLSPFLPSSEGNSTMHSGGILVLLENVPFWAQRKPSNGSRNRGN